MKLFESIPISKPKKSKFDLSHEKKLSMQLGRLIPILCQEVLPGDSFKVQTEIMMRLAPMVAPVMHRMNVFTHFFYVPNRLIWDEWKEFITGGPDGTLTPVWPNVEMNGSTQPYLQPGQLSDYLGIPTYTDGTNTRRISALPFRAYQLIFNEYYRDQTLTAEINFLKTSGNQSNANFDIINTLRKRAWEKDYFTSALPWAQRGNTSTIPGIINYTTDPTIETLVGQTEGELIRVGPNVSGNIHKIQKISGAAITATIKTLKNIDTIGVNINDLRRSNRLQQWLEKNARGGARYVEQILSHFGVKSSDARLQRPEYLGGGKQPVVISEVLNTAGGAAPVGDMSGHGISVGGTHGFKKTFEEHGLIIGIMSVLPKTAYYQGIPKMFRRIEKLDYAWPEFANIGEQAIINEELFFTGADAQTTTFGYTPRYAEYKFANNTVNGDFKTNLEFWHMGRKFAAAPALNEAFITSDPTKRIFAVTTSTVHELYVQIYHNISAIRPLPYFGTPI